jgi:hypothetical protein
MSKKAINKLHEFITDKKPNEKELTAFVKDLAYHNDPTERTITVRYSQFKKHIRLEHPRYTDEFLKELNPPTELTKKIIGENKQRKLDRKMVSFNDELIEKIYNLKDSPNPYERAIYLQFISGRRINEIYDADIRLAGKNPRIFTMRLSKKSGAESDKFHKVELLKDTISNKEFKAMSLKLRSSINGVSLQDFTNRVNRTIKKDLSKDLSSHDLRGLYAVYGYETDNPDNMNLLGYINKKLNHNSSSIDSSQSYANFKYVKS